MHTGRKILLTILTIIVGFAIVIGGVLGVYYSGADSNTTAILSFLFGLAMGWPIGLTLVIIWDSY